MTIYKPGEIVLIPFPFTDFSTLKQRPALIISSSKFNRSQGDIVAVAVTSHISKSQGRYDYSLNKDDQAAGGLPKPSIIKLAKIVTIDKRLIRKSLGRISDKTLREITLKIIGIIKSH